MFEVMVSIPNGDLRRYRDIAVAVRQCFETSLVIKLGPGASMRCVFGTLTAAKAFCCVCKFAGPLCPQAFCDEVESEVPRGSDFK